MIEAVENHMPQVIVIDEIGTELEAQAARTIAERGVQLIGTAHGNNLDNLMLNPTLSDLIGGIQSVTLGDEEARRRRTQKSVLERKAPPTFDVIVEIQDRERVAVHSDVADTIDALLRGDAVAPELRWRDEEGVHRSQGRPRPSPREQLGAERFAGLVGAGSPWRMEPGWRGDGSARTSGGFREAERGGFRPGYRPGASGGWRQTRGGSGRESAPRGPVSEGGASGVMPGERIRVAADRRGAVRRRRDRGSRAAGAGRDVDGAGDARPGGPRARAPEGLARPGGACPPDAQGRRGHGADQRRRARGGRRPRRAAARARRRARTARPCSCHGGSPLPTLRVLPQGISRKRLEQAVRDLGLPVVIARDVDEADVVMTLKNEYKQKTPLLREAEERAMPIYVLKSNTIPQMQTSLTSIFSLEIDPREAAMRETEDAIEVVLTSAEPVELSPQNAYIRRLQHQMAERANLVSRSRGREPYRRVRLYPDAARSRLALTVTDPCAGGRRRPAAAHACVAACAG